MDDATKNQESKDTAGQALIDIFYKDTYRLNSLISQINNGALRSITTTTDNVQGSISTYKGEVGIPKLVNAGGTRNTSETMKRSIRQTKSSLDDAILQLLQQLNLFPEHTLPNKIFSNLRIIQGEISLTNYKALAELIPLFGDFAPIFDPIMARKHDLEETISMLKGKLKRSKDDRLLLEKSEEELLQLKIKSNPQDKMYQNIRVVLPFLPKGIGFGIRLADDTIFTGNLKPEYLIDTEESISMNYGEKLPDIWNLLGIVDYKEDPIDNHIENPLALLLKQIKDVGQIFFDTNSKGTIIPLLIYRELDIPAYE